MDDREINCLIAEKVMGLRVFREPPFDNNPVIVDDDVNIIGLPEPYCTDIRAAWMVVGKMTEELWGITLTQMDGRSFHLDKFFCRFVGFDSEVDAFYPYKMR